MSRNGLSLLPAQWDAIWLRRRFCHSRGNALTAMVERKRFNPDKAFAAWGVFGRFPIGFIAVDIRAALKVALRHGIYAYDACVLQYAIEQRAELLTLDEQMKSIAETESVKLRGAPSS